MSDSTLFRIGGVAAILGILLSAGSAALPALLAIGALAFAVFIYALYRFFADQSPMLSLAAAVLGIGGAVLLAIFVLFFGAQNNSLQNIATWATFFVAPLFFGIVAYQRPEAGMPRILALVGIIGGVAGLVNLIIVLVGGGDWMNPDNPALSPLIMGSYYIGMLLTLVWLVWTAIFLLRWRA